MSSLGVDADVNINLEFQDNATSQIDSSTKQINKSWREMRDQQRAVGRQFELNHRTFTQTARSIQFIGNVANRAINIYQAWQLSQIRLNDAQREQRDLQRQLNEAIREGDLQKAADIQADIKKSVEEANRALLDQIAFYILAGTSAAGAAANISKKLLPALAKIGGKTTPKPSSIPSTGGSNVPKGTQIGPQKPKFQLGGAGKVGLGAAGLIAGGLAENIINSDDPLQAIKDFFFSEKLTPETKIIIKVNVNGTEQEQVIDLNNPYVVS